MNRWLQCITMFAGMGAMPAVAGFINFESGFVDQQRIYAVDTGDNVVDFSVWTSADTLAHDYAYVARAGGRETAYAPGDRIPLGHDGGSFFATDEYDGPRRAFNYRFDFANGIRSFGLDLYDYRADGGARIGDSVTLYLYDSGSAVVGSQTHIITSGLPDANLFSFDVDLGELVAMSAYLDFSRPDVGTGIDNLRFASVPEPGTYALFGLGLLGLAYARRHVR